MARRNGGGPGRVRRARTSGEVRAAGGRDSPGGPSSGARRTAPSNGIGSAARRSSPAPQRREQRDLVARAQRLVERGVHAVDEDETGGAGLEAEASVTAPTVAARRVELVGRASLAGPQLEAREQPHADRAGRAGHGPTIPLIPGAHPADTEASAAGVGSARVDGHDDAEDDIPAAPPPGESRARPPPASAAARARRRTAATQALRAVQVALIKEIDAAISKLERARMGEARASTSRSCAACSRRRCGVPRALRRAARHPVLAHLGDVRRRGRRAGRDLHHVPRAARGRHAHRRPGRELAQLSATAARSSSSATAPPASRRCSTRSSSSSPWTTASSPSNAARTCRRSRSARSACAWAWTATPTSRRCSPRRGAWTPAAW